MKRSVSLLALTLPLLLAAWPVTTAAMDNLSCFHITGGNGPRLRSRTVLGPEAGSASCILKGAPRIACIATRGTEVTPPPPDPDQGTVTENFLCYQAKCPGASLPATEFHDAFGARAATFGGSRFVCVPATTNPASTTPTTTTTPTGPTSTTTTVSGACTFRDGRCTGTCPSGGQCGAAVGTGSCECRTVSCGNADTPDCNGACSSPSEACIFSITGCSCVRIP